MHEVSIVLAMAQPWGEAELTCLVFSNSHLNRLESLCVSGLHYRDGAVGRSFSQRIGCGPYFT